MSVCICKLHMRMRVHSQACGSTLLHCYIAVGHWIYSTYDAPLTCILHTHTISCICTSMCTYLKVYTYIYIYLHACMHACMLHTYMTLHYMHYILYITLHALHTLHTSHALHTLYTLPYITIHYHTLPYITIHYRTSQSIPEHNIT